MRKVLSRQEVIDAVERRGCKNPPAFLHKFWGMGLQEKYGDKNKKELIKEIKRLFSYNNDQVGQLLGISRTTLWRILKDEKQAVID